ncbi:LysR family transcriptional regulator [Yoonia litorea]|uniref:DNA-binding transcriptional regulator, LysR family n=1 Tax=Yoonia litorea TaxID=1123755 RepID=A0A1I6MWA7_9RHOB|nr:LysR family transcriptional regulator [Yoonia litorea]SFS19990.1 DNA-binding transcriptional regulator, LysR family [Yoonia litorea]
MRRFRSWGQLQTFLSVAEAGSYRAAARKQGITSSTVARHIEAINEEIGQPVLMPVGNKWELTDAGQDLLRIAETAQANLGFMLKNLEDGSEFRGTVTINTSSFIISDHLAPAIGQWYADNPQSAVNLEASDRTTAVERGEADVALRLSRPETPGIARAKLANCNVGIYRPHGGSDSDWIGLPPAYRGLAEVTLAETHFGRDPRFRLDTFRAIAKAAEATGLSCIVPTCIARDFPALEPVEKDNQHLLVRRGLWFVFYETRKNDPVIAATRAWLKTVFPSPNRCLCGKCEIV